MTTPQPRKRGILTIDDLRANSERRPGDLCWHWLGACDPEGKPRIWTFDHDRGDKTVLTGARAVWNIAHGAGPGRWLPFRACFVVDCVCPAHHRLVRTRAEICQVAKRAGIKWGPPPEVRRKHLVAARAAAGYIETPAETVLEVHRLLQAGVTGKRAAEITGTTESTVSRIKRGQRWARLRGLSA